MGFFQGWPQAGLYFELVKAFHVFGSFMLRIFSSPLGLSARRRDHPVLSCKTKMAYISPVDHQPLLSVKTAKELLDCDFEYIPLLGHIGFRGQAVRLLLGNSLDESKMAVSCVQCPGGAAAVRIAAEFVAKVVKVNRVHVFATMTEDMYLQLRAGGIENFNIDQSDHFNLGCKFETVQNGAVIVLDVSHYDHLSKMEMEDMAAMFASRNILPVILDFGQGTRSGDPDQDGRLARSFARSDLEFLAVQSFSRNFAIQNLRLGSLVVALKDKSLLPSIESELTKMSVTLYGPPLARGARIVHEILSNQHLHRLWLDELSSRVHFKSSDEIKA
ncbi:Aspartate aminotransferase, cytoplasmic [Halotydeus destructor]|nr:Aspartate aminotransferase, cytoplasmic [Halotydeus destructor]